MTKISGSLSYVLQHSTAVWYEGEDGTHAYLEYPTVDADGVVAVNGRKIMKLIDNGSRDLSQSVKVQLLNNGVLVDTGWMCHEDANGAEINEARHQSQYDAVRHHNGKIAVQQVGSEATIFVYGRPHWTVKSESTAYALQELGVETDTGWYPVMCDLFTV